MLDFDVILSQAIASALVLWPVELAVILLIVAIRKQVAKLAALYEMAPDMSAAQRRFARWYLTSQLRAAEETSRAMLEPSKRDHPPWENP